MKKKSFILVLLMSMILFFSSCQTANNENRDKLSFFTSMNTRIDLRFDGQNTLNQHFDDIKEIFDRYHELTDNFNALPSESNFLTNIKMINDEIAKSDDLATIEIDKSLYDVLIYADQMYQDTNGYFNPYMGHVIDIWKDIIDAYTDDLVPTAVIEKAKLDAKEAGNRYLSLSDPVILITDNNRYYIKAKSGVKIDLGALAKGYALNEVRRYLETQNVSEYMISAGSSSIITGIKSGNQSYKIGLSNPIFNQGKALSEYIFYGYYYLKNSGITTSGNQEQYVVGEDGIKYHHIISPITFEPANTYQSLWIVGDQMHMLDAYSTALFSMEPTDIKAFLETYQLSGGTFNQNHTYTLYQRTNQFEIFYNAAGIAPFIHEDVS